MFFFFKIHYSSLIFPLFYLGSQRTCSKLAVLSKWQDLSDCDWIVGLEIENVGERLAQTVSLGTVLVHSGIPYISLVGREIQVTIKT